MEKVLLSPYGRLLFKVHRGDQVGRSVNLGSDRSSERDFCMAWHAGRGCI